MPALTTVINWRATTKTFVHKGVALANSTRALQIARVSLGWAMLLLAACGGGGGSSNGSPPPPPPAATLSGNGLAPESGPGDTQNYFPAAPGDAWSYNASTDDPQARAANDIRTITVGGQQTINGVAATIFHEAHNTLGFDPYDTFYRISGGGVSTVGTNDLNDDFTGLIAPFATLLFPVQAGVVSNITGKNLPAGQDSAGNPVTADLTQKIENMGFEAVNVPAGSFANALRQVTTVNATLRDSALGQTATVTGTATSWLVAGVGVVKESASATGSGSTTLTISEGNELRGYMVNGMHHGIGDPITLVSVTSDLNAGPMPPRALALGYDGLHYSLAYPQDSGTTGNVSSEWIVSALASDGSTLVSSHTGLTTPAETVPHTAAIAAGAGNFLDVLQVADSAFGTSGVGLYTVLSTADAASVPTTPVLLTPGGGQQPAAAFDGSHYLVAYEQLVAAGVGQLFGIFVSPQTGAAIGSAFAITPVEGNHGSVALAFDGTNYLVVWDTQSTLSPSGEIGIYAARISQAGTIVGTNPIAIALSSSTANCCALHDTTLAFDGTNYLIAYADGRTPGSTNNDAVSAARLSPAGQLLDGTPSVPGINVATTTNSSIGSLCLAFTSGSYWLAWTASSSSGFDGMYGARVATTGAVVSPGLNGFRMTPPGYALYPAIAGGPGGGLLAWFWSNPTPAPAAIETIGGLRIDPPGT